MKKALFIILFITLSCSHDYDDCPKPTFDPCDCLLVTDPVTWQSTDENGVITHTTYFVGKNECKGISEPMHHITTNINEVPKEFSCYEN
jgi:hypothetical protein